MTRDRQIDIESERDVQRENSLLKDLKDLGLTPQVKEMSVLGYKQEGFNLCDQYIIVFPQLFSSLWGGGGGP